MSRQQIARERARAALARVREVKETTETDHASRNAYVSYLEGLPATIVSIGLGQTVAMLLARSAGAGESGRGGGNAGAYRLLAQHLERWLCQEWKEGPYLADLPSGSRPGEVLMDKIVEKDQAAYTLARAEALAYLDWLKKLGVGLLKEEGDGRTRAP